MSALEQVHSDMHVCVCACVEIAVHKCDLMWYVVRLNSPVTATNTRTLFRHSLSKYLCVLKCVSLCV